MSTYWLGLATIPAACLIFAGAMFVLRGLVMLTKPVEVALRRLTSDADERQRALIGAVFYGATRVWMLSAGDLGIAFIAGQKGRDRAEAFNRLYDPPRLALRDLKRAAPASEGGRGDG